ncbi:MAG: alkaline phosphatase family protein, partial [Chloroflexi bacterium]|nr:alkaline phosphatase family protein [Chloroflexota bacterium]
MATDTGERTLVGPERAGGQGLDHNQEESGNRAIELLLTHDVVGDQTDFVATYRDGAYEVWAKRGMVRFQRSYGADGGYEYHVIETVGSNPIERQDPTAIATIEEELEAARLSGHPTDDPTTAYIEPEQLTHPLAYERIAQLFDSPNAPDLVVNPKTYAFGRQPGQHGAMDVVQSRAPLIFSGPGVRAGVSEGAASHVDIAPTIARLMRFPQIDGRDATGRPSSQVYFKRQDGRALDEIIDVAGDVTEGQAAERTFLLHLDGLSNSELRFRLEDGEAIPNLRRIIERGHMFRYGSIVNFPSITWPSHNTIGTSCWGGHHDIVNPTYYLRETRETITPQGQQFDSAKFLGDEVETLYEAFHRVHGAWSGQEGAFTAAIHEPCTRGADHSVLERRIIGDRDRLRAVTKECEADINPRWQADGEKKLQNIAIVDTRGIAQVLVLFSDDSHPPPMFTFCELTLTDSVGHDHGAHSEALRDALDETDLRIGRLLRLLDERGLFESTLFVMTTDHGMAATKTELAANQVARLPEEGLKAVVPSPLVYLIDMAVEIEPALDGRTATFTVLANDADSSGERPPVAGATINVSDRDGKTLGQATTDDYGT